MSANQDSASRKFDTVGYLVAGVVFLIACCTCWVAIVHSPELSTALKGAVHDTARQVGLAQDTEPVKPAVKLGISRRSGRSEVISWRTSERATIPSTTMTS